MELTSSTAAGVLVESTSFKGLAKGSARGGAPSAWLAVYKICWSTGGCSSADLLAAFDDAIFDEVEIISVSLGSYPPLPSYVEDVLAIGSFHAVAKGVSVVCSGGNSGPYAQTVINTAPWVITVAASTIDREFPSTIILGNNQTIQPRSQRSATAAVRTVMEVEGVGLIYAQFPTNDVDMCWGIPSVQVDFTAGTKILSYMEATRNPVIKFSKTRTVVGQQMSPDVALFSSRGPSSLSPSVLKPDIAAPGVNILAAWSPASYSSQQSDASQDELTALNFNIESGTSMSCPHIYGIIALMKTVCPTWSPAAIKSALVTTGNKDLQTCLF
ncbi:putative tripeptidyl-peptidase II [Medicago truncatula]|uniref:Putative tripeptidyl-peptidase II n=1 Tax=Medicago truncatula TaxID=3880 RepID=A0A396ICB5_MEDTR|nr:putative tripeptidyl-peptidase II [Medicago truncatula]